MSSEKTAATSFCARGGVPAERRGRFTALLRTSTIFARLAKRDGERGGEMSGGGGGT